MPDLQSELTKVLTQTHFDDDADAAASPPAWTKSTRTHETSSRRVVWNFIRTNAGSTMSEICGGTGFSEPFCYSAVGALYKSGRLTREKESGSHFRYTAISDNYNDRLRNRAEALKTPKKARKARKAKTPAAVEAPKAPERREFNADEVLRGLNIIEAKQLLVRLQNLFSA